MKKLITLVLLITGSHLFAAESNKLWSDVSVSQARTAGVQAVNTTHCRHLQLNLPGMKQLLNNAPFEFTPDAKSRKTIVEIPMPDGTFQRFSIVESPVCAPELAARYPETKTWAGQGIDDPLASVRLDVTPWGFHSMIISNGEEIFIDPYNMQTTELYMCYNKRDAIRGDISHTCGFGDFMSDFDKKQVEELRDMNAAHANKVSSSAGDILRKYRLALACSGEYAAVFGTTKPPVHAAIVTAINRVTQVYEYEMAIRLILIPNNDTLIYFTLGTPYTNNNGGTMLGQNQSNITSKIGSANYDIGHVFSTGGGGVAGLGVVCQSTQKARGVTGLPTPTGDPFYIDFVAHEMGHQFGGNHTFNSVTGNCGGGNRSAGAAYEPGSGITVMAYAGICGTDDDSTHSIPYFHTKSFDEIQNYTTFSSGSVCPTTTVTGNNPPVSGLTVFHYEVPVNTPFKLTGIGSDPDNDPLTYSWEEWDLAATGGAWNSPTGNAPIFRSNTPSSLPYRLFPKLSNILANTNTIGELKPSYARLMHFRLTLRDMRINGGGVTYDDTPVEVNVTGTTPFAITYPNVTGITWLGGSSQTITWNVSGTTAAPISTPNVNIYLSTTGGTTYPFPTLIAANVPNTGSYTFTVPNTATSQGRILVEGANNIFFDINDKNFVITPTAVAEQINDESVNIIPNPAQDFMQLTLSGKLRGKIDVAMTDASGRMVKRNSFTKTQEGLVENIDISKLAKGVYVVSIVSEKGTSTQRLVKN